MELSDAEKHEPIRLIEANQTAAPLSYQTSIFVKHEEWTGNYIFENEWHSFRTRQLRALELVDSDPRTYPSKSRYKAVVKVIDIFGNDTTEVIEVKL